MELEVKSHCTDINICIQPLLSDDRHPPGYYDHVADVEPSKLYRYYYFGSQQAHHFLDRGSSWSPTKQMSIWAYIAPLMIVVQQLYGLRLSPRHWL